MMSSSTLMIILTATAFAVPAVVWLCLRVYAVVCAAVRCRRCRGSREGCPLPETVLREIETAGRNLTWMLAAVLVLLVGLWLLGTSADQRIAVGGIGIGALTACGMFVFSMLTNKVLSMILPGGMICRARLIAAVRKNSGRTGWMIALYVLVHMLLSIA